MKRHDLVLQKHAYKMRDHCGDHEPNVTEDCIFYLDNKPIGFYMREAPTKLLGLVKIANKEFLSDRVPKTLMSRGPKGSIADQKKRIKDGVFDVDQFSTIIGAVAEAHHMRRPFPGASHVHNTKSANTFIKCMLMMAKESEALVKELLPEQHANQVKLITENVPPQFKFGNMFTSSISNYNIAVNFHQDRANIQGCSNIILTKRKNATGGNLCVPDFGITIDSCNNSVLYYPAWANMHGVTPIVATAKGGYRNSLIFYPLKSFKKYLGREPK